MKINAKLRTDAKETNHHHFVEIHRACFRYIGAISFKMLRAILINVTVGSKGYCNCGHNRAFVRTYGKGVK
jgi:hypothetical protein